MIAEVLPHWDAVKALLTNLSVAYPGLAGFGGGEVPTNPGKDAGARVRPYWVFYPGAGQPTAAALCGVSGGLRWPFTVVCVGGTVEEALWVRDRVCGALVDVEPLVAGRVSGRVRLDYSVGPVRRGDDVPPPRFEVPLLFTLDTEPA